VAEHVMNAGDCLFTVAEKSGFCSIDPIWKHARNKSLAATRQPGMLVEGDAVFIPPQEPKTIELSTGEVHDVVVKTVPAFLRLCLKDGDGQPLGNQPYRLEMGAVVREGNTDGDGILEEKVPLPAASMTLHFAGRKLALGTGRLVPFTGDKRVDVMAAQARLRNLAYEPGPLDGIAGKRTRSAVSAFQVAEGVEVTGKLDQPTIDKLKATHGR